ncbi:hypothetical protein ACTGJ9_018430 [Bradyrhizobium sp. RDM12]
MLRCTGVTGTGRREEQPDQPADETNGRAGSPPVETLTLETIIPGTILPLVNALRPRNTASGTPPIGAVLLNFCRPGVRVYRSKLGIRKQERLRSKGRPAHDKYRQSIIDDIDAWPEALPA